jgi:hypothetical protein
MSISLSWDRIETLHSELKRSDGIEGDSKLIFYIANAKKEQIKRNILFDNFLSFFWSLYDTLKFSVARLIITDQQGNTLYTHKRNTYTTEIVPTKGNPYMIEHWTEFNKNQKDAYLCILISQISSNEQQITQEYT